MANPEIFYDGRVTLYRGDCRKIVPELEPVHHVIGDPPYEAPMHRSKGRARKRKLRTDGGPELKGVPFDSIERLRADITGPLVEACSGWLILFCTPEGIAPWRDAIEAAGARYKRACFWIKPDAAPQMNGQGPGYAVEPFVTAWCGRGVSKWNGGGGKNYLLHNTNNSERTGEFSTEKPLSLMSEIIRKFTKPDDLILDPFMGSGSTILAALGAGRRAIGIEKDATTYRLARARIESVFMGSDEAVRHRVKAIGVADLPLFAPVKSGKKPRAARRRK